MSFISPTPITQSLERKILVMCLHGKRKWGKKERLKKASREIYQLKDGMKNLACAIRECAGNILLFYCYNGTYPGPKILLHLKKIMGNLANVERRTI